MYSVYYFVFIQLNIPFPLIWVINAKKTILLGLRLLAWVSEGWAGTLIPLMEDFIVGQS